MANKVPDQNRIPFSGGKKMLEFITSVNNALNAFIWGVPAMVCIIGVGMYLAVRTNFLQLRKFGYSMKSTIGKIKSREKAAEGC